MKPKVPSFSFKERAAEKAAARERDEELLRSGEASHADMARANGGSIRGVRYKSPAERIQALAAKHTFPPSYVSEVFGKPNSDHRQNSFANGRVNMDLIEF